MASSENSDRPLVLSSKLLQYLAGALTEEWLDVARNLSISDAKLHKIKADNPGNEKEKIYQMLIFWQHKKGPHATHNILVEALQNAKRSDLSDKVRDVNNAAAGTGFFAWKEETSTTLGFEKFQDDLSAQISTDSRGKLAVLFNFPPAKLDKVRNNNLAFVRALREEGIISSNDISPLLNALESIDRKVIATIVQESFERNVGLLSPELQPFVTPYDTFAAHLSTHLTAEAIEVICRYFNVPDWQKSIILSHKSPGLACMQYLHRRTIISSSNISALIRPLDDAKLVQAVAKVNEYEANAQITLSWSTKHLFGITSKEKLLVYVKARLQSWYETTTPLPWKKSCEWSTADLFISRRLILRDNTTGDATSCKIKYCDIFTHEKLARYNRIVIDGEPGSGKTLLSTQIAYDWCKDKIAGTDLLLFVPLRLVESAKLSRVIKLFYVPEEDSTITEDDIETVLTEGTISCSLLLDGLEEYTGDDIGNEADSSEVTKILRKKKYPKCKVAITARTDVARDLKGCSKLTISGFGHTERVDYVRKVFPEDDEKQDQILSDITSNELIKEMCDTPLLFVLAVHNLGNIGNAEKGQMTKVTPFMNSMIEAMCPKDSNIDSSSLQKLAFEGLCSGTQTLIWTKEYVTTYVENTSRWIDSGILVIEESVTSSQEDKYSNQASYQTDPETATEAGETTPTTFQNNKKSRNLKFSKLHAETVPMQIRFLHKVVQEWFSAKHFSTLTTYEMKDSLKKIKPDDLHFILRFTCGLNWDCTHLILHHLCTHYQDDDGKLPDYIEKVFYQCYAEHDLSEDTLTEIIATACSRDICFSKKDSILCTRSKATLLKQAYDLGKPIKGMTLEDVGNLANKIPSGTVPTSNAVCVELKDDNIEKGMRGLRKLLLADGRIQDLTLKFQDKIHDLEDKHTLKWFNDQGSCVIAIAKGTAYVLQTTTGKWKLLKDLRKMLHHIAEKFHIDHLHDVGAELDLNDVILGNIAHNNKGDAHQMKVCMLKEWLQRSGEKAHAVTLISAFRNCRFESEADELSKILLPKPEASGVAGELKSVRKRRKNQDKGKKKKGNEGGRKEENEREEKEKRRRNRKGEEK